MSVPSEPRRKFPDFLPSTKVLYDGARPQTIQVRTCRLVTTHAGSRQEHPFAQSTIRIGAMEDNDLVVSDETVSRFHCRIEQDEQGYLLRDLGSTNGTAINGVRIREAYLNPSCTISIGQTDIHFLIGQERVEVVPSTKNRLGDIIGKNVSFVEHTRQTSRTPSDHSRERVDRFIY
ncbi:MAG: FHA domain-containing protein [Myxococcales bacterium]|nr:FHA domain-containing protein [Myxococcales bacterium]